MKLKTLLPLLTLPLVLSACSGLSSMNTLDPASSLTADILSLYERITWWAVLLFVAVQGLLIYAVIRFRAKGDETGEPEQVHGNTAMEVTWTILPVVILLNIGIPTVSLIFKSQQPAPEDAVQIHATGKQWWFAFEYPALGITTANEIHVPLGQPIEVRLQSDNVIHSFWVPQLMAKRDMIPGRVNRIVFTPNKVGRYDGQCAEYCGDSHAKMRFQVVVDTPEDFAKWAKEQAAPAVASDEGYKAFEAATCNACHAIKGTAAAMKVGPDLTHVASRAMIGAGWLDNNPENLKKWIHDPASIKPGSKMPKLPLDEAQINSLAAYLQSLK